MPLRCAIVGLDSAFWPTSFWQVANDHPETTVAAACGLGIPPEVIEKDFVLPVDPWLEERGLRRVPTLDELVAEEDFEVALLCSRNTVMPGVAERLIDAGKHVFVAKPLALSSVDARRYLPARTRGVVVTAGQLASTWQPWPTMLRLASEGRIGRLLTMRVTHQHLDFAGFPDQLWYTDPAEGDLCNWLGWYPVEAIVAALGPIARVTGVARQAASAHGSMADHVVGLFELADGRHATANVYFTIDPAWPMPMHEGELVGDAGVLRHMGPGNLVQILDDDGAHLVAFDDGPEQLALEFARFVTAIHGKGEPLLPVERAVHVAEVCAAWRDSTAQGQSVPVPAPPSAQ